MGSDSKGRDKDELLDLDEPTDGVAEAIAESGLVARPTLKPAFDLEHYAQETVPAMRERQMTISDEHATEQARLASVLIDSKPPPGAALRDPNGVEALRARLAPLSRVPALAKSITELGDAVADPRAAFVLGFVDGLLPLETIIEVTGLPELETLQVLDRFIAQGAVVFPAR